MLLFFSLSLLDPNDLAAKGATLLHHLAVWMIEENKNKEARSSSTLLPDSNTSEELPSSLVSNITQNIVPESKADLDRSEEEYVNFRADITTEKDVTSLSDIGTIHVRLIL